jgi:DNA helicase-2/ATP-dependent DNA helicase PcrA
MEDGIFPSDQNIGNEDEMSEERRLCYVAITRAKDKLFITYAKNRTMYGRTNYNMLSQFIRGEIPPSLIERQMPRREPPRSGVSYFGLGDRQKSTFDKGYNREMRRTPDIFSKKENTDAKNFGIEKFSPGTEVTHSAFGDGVIISAKDMGGDILYEVEFASVGRKKLMATFARLVKKGGIVNDEGLPF